MHPRRSKSVIVCSSFAFISNMVFDFLKMNQRIIEGSHANYYGDKRLQIDKGKIWEGLRGKERRNGKI